MNAISDISHRVIDDHAVLDASADAVGGKAWQLAQLRRYGLPVAEFIVLPAAAAAPTDEAEHTWAAVQARGWADKPLAVRSSAVGEDGAHASFAGIHRSCLNVCGAAQLAEAIAAVRASLLSDSARAYRQRLGIAGQARMAVIIMPLLPAVAAGIAFTCDPRDGREDRMLIHAHWGLGEALVGGEADGDEYLLAEDATDSWRVLSRRLGDKAQQRRCADGGGTELHATPVAQTSRQVLDAAQIETLAALLRDAAYALDFVAPFYDLEWLWDGARFWLTQARPVTRRPHYTYPALHAQPAIWTRGNTCELLPDPLAAFDWNFSRRGVNALLEQGARLAGYPLQDGVQRAGLFHGRLYLEASIMQWELWDALDVPPASMNVMMGGHQPEITVPASSWRERLRRGLNMLRYLRRAGAVRQRGEAAIVRVRAMAQRLRAAPPPAEHAALRAAIQEAGQVARSEFDMFFLQGSGGGSLSLLRDTLEKAFPGEGDALGAALLAGGEASVTVQQNYALLALAQRARQEGRESTGFQRALADFMQAYGHRGHYETYFRSASWREQPDSLLAQLDSLADIDADALRQRQQLAAAQAWARIRQHAPWPTRLLLRWLARAANRECNQREAARSALIDNLDAVRHLADGAMALLRQRGVLHADEGRDALQHLFLWEIDSACQGSLAAASLRARLLDRQARFARWQAETAPEYLLIQPDGQRAAGVLPASPIPTDGQRWRGVATGAGVARGRVRRIRHPAEGVALQAGEILLAPATDPGWTPLFLKAGGLVVETGGYLSHAAIVAREFALPAVVNLPGIMEALQDGEWVEVDGGRGVVRRVGEG